MYNKVKPVKHFAITSAEKVAVFLASLKLVQEEAGSQISNKDNKHSTTHRSNCLSEWGTINKNDVLLQRQ